MQEAAALLRRGGRDVQQIATLTEVPAALVALMKDDLLGHDPIRSTGAGARYGVGRRARTRRLLLLTTFALSVAAIGCSLSALITAHPALGDVGVIAAALALLGLRLASRARR